MRTIGNFTGFLSGMLLAAALFLFLLPKARGDTSVDLPKEVPLTSTLFYTCEHGGTAEIVALIVTFKDGKVIRIDAQNMHGIPEAKYVAAYGDLAADKQSYGVGGCGATRT